MAGRVTHIPVARGIEWTRTRRLAGDRRAVMVLAPIVILVVMGLGALSSASSVLSLQVQQNSDNLFYVKRQLVFVGGGVVALIAAARVPYRWYSRNALIILGLAVGSLVATLLVGSVRNGAKSWIEIGSFTLQPSEFAKFAVVVFLATALTRKEQWLGVFSHFFWPVAASLGVVGALVVAQRDFGTAMIIGVAGLIVLLASAAPLRFVLGSAGIASVLAVSAALAEPYRRRRLLSFLDPMADRLDSGLQVVQGLVALQTGGLFGVGLGASRARWMFLPNAHSDFIFAIIGEELGFAGAISVVALFMAFAFSGVLIALRAPDRFGRLLAIGIVAWITFQAFVNVGGVVGVVPITGVPLPFISAGGSAMLVNLAAMGVLVNIARTAGKGTS
ncbi:MAG: putative lipid II flippase FtsW [Acidimicrobiia bacterium]|nr:putative lipid II flippase FtsW [Acidimicrobiia bacterium]MBT8215181.1 putative lipid II flippase FtsW [Acidimicrobiia bacterium]NNF69497.1 putative lipid II flippase FtsW [Acidimicrobiia bacterium]NNK91413.1 putative lipid II flippase FtsW [Acidimicrobiia bacterium]